MYKINEKINTDNFRVIHRAIKIRDEALFTAKIFMKKSVNFTLKIELMKQMRHVHYYLNFHS